MNLHDAEKYAGLFWAMSNFVVFGWCCYWYMIRQWGNFIWFATGHLLAAAWGLLLPLATTPFLQAIENVGIPVLAGAAYMFGVYYYWRHTSRGEF